MYYYSYYYYDCSCYDCWSLLMTTIVTAAIRQTCNRCTLPHTKAFREPCRRGKARRLEDVDVAQRQRRVEQCQQNAPKLSVPCQARLTPAVARNSGSPHRGESLSGGSTLGPSRSPRPGGGRGARGLRARDPDSGGFRPSASLGRAKSIGTKISTLQRSRCSFLNRGWVDQPRYKQDPSGNPCAVSMTLSMSPAIREPAIRQQFHGSSTAEIGPAAQETTDQCCVVKRVVKIVVLVTD